MQNKQTANKQKSNSQKMLRQITIVRSSSTAKTNTSKTWWRCAYDRWRRTNQTRSGRNPHQVSVESWLRVVVYKDSDLYNCCDQRDHKQHREGDPKKRVQESIRFSFCEMLRQGNVPKNMVSQPDLEVDTHDLGLAEEGRLPPGNPHPLSLQLPRGHCVGLL